MFRGLRFWRTATVRERVDLEDSPAPSRSLFAKSLCSPHHELHLHGADLNDVAGAELSRLAGVDANAVDPRSVEAVQVFDHHVAFVEGHSRVLSRAPDL